MKPIVLLAWWFVHILSYGGTFSGSPAAVIYGPFPSADKCEKMRLRISYFARACVEQDAAPVFKVAP